MSNTSAASRISARRETSLEAPPRLWSRSVVGPSAVFTALAIGSGELIFWPGLTLGYGPGVLWIAIAAVAVQYVINVEIARYSLATGESVIVGATRLWSGLGWALLAGAIVPWLWPGWARAGSQLLSAVSGLPEKPITIASLLICGAILALPARVYQLVEQIQTFLLAFILAGVLLLFLIAAASVGDTRIVLFFQGLLTGEGIAELLTNASSTASTAFLTLLGGLVFAGAGGILNLGYGLMLCEKGFAMGRHAQPIVGLRHSLGLQSLPPQVPPLADDIETRQHWSEWLSLSRREHGLFFVGGNAFTIVVLSLTFFALSGNGGTPAQGTAFLETITGSIRGAIGSFGVILFVGVAYAILFTSELGIIDVTSRLAAGLVYELAGSSKRLSASALYHAIVWSEIACGIGLTLFDPRQPYWFLVTTAILNTLVMGLYTLLVVVINRRRLPSMARPSYLVSGGLTICALGYVTLFILTIARL